MIKFLQCIGAVIYSLVFAFFLNLGLSFLNGWLFYFILKYLWLIPLVIFLEALFFRYLIENIISCILSILFIPLYFCVKDNIVAKIIAIIPFLVFGFINIIELWKLDIDYNFIKYVIAFCLSLFVFGIYQSIIMLIFNGSRNENENNPSSYE